MIFEVDNSSFKYANKRKKLMLGKGITDALNDSTVITLITLYLQMILTKQQKKTCLRLHYNLSNDLFICQLSKNLSI